MKFYLSDIKSKEDLRELFIEKWNWEPTKISELFLDFPNETKEKIEECSVLAEKLNYKIFFFSLNRLEKPEKELRFIERKIINEPELKKNAENNVFIFSAHNFAYLDFVKAEKIGARLRLKRFSISPENRDKLRTPCEQLEKLRLDPKQATPSYIKNKIEEAFSVEAVTEKFYQEYIDVFQKIKKSLIKQKVEIYEGKKEDKLRDFIHKTLNRIMFLYFVQKRGCFGEDKNFLANFWDAYKSKFKGKNIFHKEWLNTLFFEALSLPSWWYNGKPSLGKFNEILKKAPYLNGGLFERDDLDNIGWEIPDELFDDIFEFFEGYNFTIEESASLDIEIAINPEMLGNIYEHLVNIEEREEQAKAGIFYTPKVEIELMIRRALVEFLFNKTKIDKEKLYKFIFRELGEEIEDPFTQEEAKRILKELEEIFILDPACGSGHYLVVALHILYELKEILWRKLKKPHLDKYEEKKKIIERNIYGNDIKKWATEIAKLRLWLELFVDAKEEVLETQIEPLLPNLNFKIRYGDSLVQRIGNEIIPLRRIKSVIKSRGGALKILFQRKEYVYKTSNPNEYKKTLYLEKKVLWDALEEKEIETQKDIQAIIAKLGKTQPNLLGENIKDKQKTLSEERLKKEKASLEATLKNIKKFTEELRKEEEAPMLWDLAFAEVFQIKNGFDIVIANPPYVRQERIEDLADFYSKKEYKEKLIEQTIKDWAYNYEGKLSEKSPLPEKFDKRCDLYVYFYLKGLKLLNPDGVLCYISSNSWLDVSYGRVLQEVLIKRCPIVAIYDNQVKRSFKHADVNTIIAVLKAPKTRDFDKEIKENEVQFLMFKKPFEEIMYSEVFIELENDHQLKQFPEGKRRETELYRLHVVNQKDLYEFGRDKNTGQYIGNKWGGKYLRAPEIYWIILEKGKDKLVRLGDIAEVRFGIKTGANEFFYLPSKYFDIKKEGNYYRLIPKQEGLPKDIKIEEEFLKPVIRSIGRINKIKLRKEDEKEYILFCPPRIRSSLEVFKYIKFGEKKKLHQRPTTKNRHPWYYLGPDWKPAPILWSYFFTDKYLVAIGNGRIYANKEFFIIYPKSLLELRDKLALFLNCSIVPLWIEINGVSNIPSLVKTRVYDIPNIPIISPKYLNFINPEKFSNFMTRKISSIFTELGLDPSQPIRQQEPNPLPDRKALDDIVFDALGLTEEERKEVYWAVAELVKNRLEKARSV